MMRSHLLRSTRTFWLFVCCTALLSAIGCSGVIGGPTEFVMLDGGATTPDQFFPTPDRTTPPPDQTSNPDDPNPNPDEATPQEVYFADMQPFIQEFCINCHGADGRMVSLGVYQDVTHRRSPVEFWGHALERIRNQTMPPVKPDAEDAMLRFRQGVQLFEWWEKAGFPEKKGGTTNPNENKGKENPALKFPELATCKGKEPMPARLWRLTSEQVKFSMRDIFGEGLTLPDVNLSYKRVQGFQNNAKESGLSDVDVTDLVKKFGEFSPEVMAKNQEWKDCLEASGDQCAKDLINKYGRLIWRRALTQGEKDKLLQGFTELSAEANRQTGLEYLVERMLMSTNFLFRSEYGEPVQGQAGVHRLTSHEVASLLSYFIWQSVPDDALLGAAEKDELQTTQQINAQVDRMLQDDRAKRGLTEFFNDWLQMRRIFTQEKDPQQFPELDNSMRQHLWQSSQLYIEEMLWTRKASLKQFFTSSEAFVNGPVAQLYQGVNASGPDFTRVTLDSSRRVGILTSAAYLTAHSGRSSTGFVHRGVFFLDHLACRPIPEAPPGAVEAGQEKVKNVDTSKMTQREIQKLHASDPSCAACHKIIDPAGAAFEIFDPLGRFRSTEKGLNIDASGELKDFGDMKPNFQNAVELAANLANSEHFQQCFTLKLYTYGLGRPPEGSRNCAVAHAYETMKQGKFTLLDGYKAVLSSPEFFLRKAPEQK